MSKKVLILSGSPRKDGNSDLLCGEFARGAQENGNEVEIIKANFSLFDFALTGDEMTRIAALNQDKRYYTSTPELLAKYAEMVPPVDEQK